MYRKCGVVAPVRSWLTVGVKSDTQDSNLTGAPVMLVSDRTMMS